MSTQTTFRDERMVLPTPFHERVAAANEMNEWYNWMGYTCALSYTDVEMEYFAIRNHASVFDLTPMTKYRIEGPDAEAYLNRLFTRDVSKIRVGRVGYGVWCDDAGQVQDDGTLFHLDDNRYRLCSQERCLDWLLWAALGFDVEIEDETAKVAPLSLQGPTSCAVLKGMGLSGVENLKPFDLQAYPFDGGELLVSRTGYTGDLGYELWTAPEHAIALWDALFEAGRLQMIRPIGTLALDIARIEAGFIMAGRDFVPAEQQVRNRRSRSPYELGLDWLVDLSKPNFNGRRALIEEKKNGSRYRFVRLDVEGNKPAEHAFIYNKRHQVIGHVTSAAWCPTAKTNVAMASLERPWGEIDDEMYAEIYYMRELHWTRLMARCRVLDKPVFEPERRRQTPAPDF